MTEEERSSVYQATTRGATLSAYHADARVMARMGFAPVSEDWSTANLQVLTVRYVHAPEQAPAVLEALAKAEAEVASSPPESRPPIQQSPLKRAASLYLKARETKVTVGGGVRIASGIALGGFLAGSIFDDDPLFFGLAFAATVMGLIAGLLLD